MNRYYFNGDSKLLENENIPNLLSELDFENIYFLMSSIKEIFQTNQRSNPNTNLVNNCNLSTQNKSPGNYNESIKIFHSQLNLLKILLRSNHFKENEKTETIKKLKMIKAYVIIYLWRLNYTKNSEILENSNVNSDFSKTEKSENLSGTLKEILNSIEIKELSHTIFSHFMDESSSVPNDFDSNSFDIFLNLILSSLLGDNLNFKYIISLIEQNSENSNSPNSNLNFPFEIFIIYFRYVALFFLYSEKMKLLFDVLDKENKSKILTVEFIICGKKIKRNLGEDDTFSQLLTKMIELIDTKEVYIMKTQFYNFLFNSIINM